MIFYIKTLILIAIICVCGYIGYLKSIKYQNRLEEQKAFFNLIQTIKSKIEFTATPIQEILNEYQAPKSLQNFIKIVLQNLAEQQTLEQSCQNALNQSTNDLTKEDKQIITNLTKQLGTTSKQDQLNYLTQTLMLLNRQIEEATIQKNKNLPLHRKLGLLAGLTLAILLI